MTQKSGVPSAANYKPETCAFCRGVGKVQSPGTGNLTSCNSCNGQGSVLVAQPARVCSFCNGTGRVQSAGTLTQTSCNSCNGTGWANWRWA